MEAETGQTVLVYMLDGFAYLEPGLAESKPRWRRSLFRPPTETDWSLWQFSHRGRVAGIDGDVDVNVAALDQLTVR